jgi:pyruvate formate lyase activating enzyme
MEINYGGIIPFSTVDYPGKVAATIFLAGCHVGCPRCHNKHLWNKINMVDISYIKDIINDLDKTFINAIVISGGEPLEQLDGIIEIAKYIKSLDMKVGLHTSGEGDLAKCIEYFDFILLNTIRE